jgi:hypothetical protein
LVQGVQATDVRLESSSDHDDGMGVVRTFSFAVA